MAFLDEVKSAIRRAEHGARDMQAGGGYFEFSPELIYGLGRENFFLLAGADIEAIRDSYSKRDYQATLEQTWELARLINEYKGGIDDDYRLPIVMSAFLSICTLVGDLWVATGLKQYKAKTTEQLQAAFLKSSKGRDYLKRTACAH